jgi:hypothetical protein
LSDLNDLTKPDGGSSYQTEVWQTVRGHFKRLWTMDYTGMAGLAAGMKRLAVSNDNLQLFQKNSDDSETKIFDLSSSIGKVAFGGCPAFDGVKFPSNQVPSSNVNTLDDYEEGEWTPAFAGSTTAGSAVYSRQYGRYTKIGNLVTVFFDMATWSGLSGASGQLLLRGLPFQVALGPAYIAGNGATTFASSFGAGVVSRYFGFLTQLYTITITAIPNSASASFCYGSTNTGANTDLNVASAGASVNPGVVGSFSYITK